MRPRVSVWGKYPGRPPLDPGPSSKGDLPGRALGVGRGWTGAGLVTLSLRGESILAELESVAAELERYRSVSVPQVREDLSLRWRVERGLLPG